MSLLSLSWQYLPWLAVLLLICRLTYLRYGLGLNKYRGPFWASVSDFWRIWDYWARMDAPPEVRTHEKYGDIVRTAPQHLSFAQPEAIRDIYGPGTNFQKSELYSVAAAVVKGEPTPTLFSSTNKPWHDRLRRSVNNAFSMTSLLNYEQNVDDTIDVFLAQWHRKCADGTPLNLERWMHYYAMDVIGAVVYSSRYGFLDTASDVDGVISKLQSVLDYAQTVGLAPWLDRLFKKNPVLLWLGRHGWMNTTNSLVPRAIRSQAARLQAYARGEKSKDDQRLDLLDRLIHAKLDHPDTMDDGHILRLGLSMIFAGSDSTMATLTAIFYYLLKNPACMAKLVHELDEVPNKGRLSFAETNRLPYLDACVKEAFRVHPATRFAPERIIPPEGATICGEQVPGGTIVGVNPWVVHRNQEVFGDDVHVYRPERWLEDPEKAIVMNRTLFQFGAGNYHCIGKNISLMEMYKLVPTLIREFEIKLVDPEKEWKLESGTFVRQTGVVVKIAEKSRLQASAQREYRKATAEDVLKFEAQWP